MDVFFTSYILWFLILNTLFADFEYENQTLIKTSDFNNNLFIAFWAGII